MLRSTYTKMIRRLINYSWLKNRFLAPFSPKFPVYVFHHIPKCGGTSIVKALDDWFVVKRDYRYGPEDKCPRKVNLDSLRSSHCLCGHWDVDNYYLYQRYPEIFNSINFKVFSFLRNPLEVSLSLFRHEKKVYPDMAISLDKHLFLRPNYIAKRFPVTEENYREILDRYFFIGILEEAQASLKTLAHLLGKRELVMPWVNQTEITANSTRNSLAPDLIEKFQKKNRLDYLIYDYCKRKLHGN